MFLTRAICSWVKDRIAGPRKHNQKKSSSVRASATEYKRPKSRSPQKKREYTDTVEITDTIAVYARLDISQRHQLFRRHSPILSSPTPRLNTCLRRKNPASGVDKNDCHIRDRWGEDSHKILTEPICLLVVRDVSVTNASFRAEQFLSAVSSTVCSPSDNDVFRATNSTGGSTRNQQSSTYFIMTLSTTGHNQLTSVVSKRQHENIIFELLLQTVKSAGPP